MPSDWTESAGLTISHRPPSMGDLSSPPTSMRESVAAPGQKQWEYRAFPRHPCHCPCSPWGGPNGPSGMGTEAGRSNSVRIRPDSAARNVTRTGTEWCLGATSGLAGRGAKGKSEMAVLGSGWM